MRGLRIGERPDELLQHVTTLASDIVILFRQLQCTQNLDNLIHADESAKIFLFGDIFPYLSLFLLTIATDSNLVKLVLLTSDEIHPYHTNHDLQPDSLKLSQSSKRKIVVGSCARHI